MLCAASDSCCPACPPAAPTRRAARRRSPCWKTQRKHKCALTEPERSKLNALILSVQPPQICEPSLGASAREHPQMLCRE